MGAAGLHLRHDLGDGCAAILRQAVDAAPDQEVGPEFLGQAEEFVDVALAVADMHAALRRACQFGGQAQIVEPAHALLLLDGHTGRIDLALERRGPFELGARPKLGGCHPEGQAVRRDRQAGVHQEPADRVLLVAAFLQLASGRHLGEPDLFRRGAFEVEFRSVLQDQHGTIGGPDAQGGGGEMPLEDFVFADTSVGEEPVSRLGVRPVLERRGQRFPWPLPESFEHCPKPPVQPDVPQIATGGFRFHPILPHARTSIIRCHMTNHNEVVASKTKYCG